MPPIFIRHLFASPALLVVALGSLPLVSMAQGNVSVPIEIEHSSNPALTADEAVGVTRFRVSPQYTLERQDGSIQTRFSMGGVLERSSNTSVSSHRSDPNLSYEIEQVSPVGNLGLRTSLSESSTRGTEFAETGVVTSDGTQRNIVLDGTWRRELSDVSRLELGLGASKVRYDTSSLVGYREFRSSIGVSYDLVDEMQLAARWEGSQLHPEQGADRSSRRSFVVGLSNQVSEALRFVAEAGSVRSTGLGASRTPSTLLRLEYAGERLTSTLEWSRSTAISGTLAGYTATRLFGWTVGYAWSERTSISFSTSQTRSQGAVGSVGSTWMAGLRHSLSDFWSIEGRLGQLRTRPEAGGNAHSNVAGLILTYSHPDF
jgi:hypothetical protein